jgi:hypothetical protein
MLPAMNRLIGMFFYAAAFAPNWGCWPSMIYMQLTRVFKSSLSRIPMMLALSFLQHEFPIVHAYLSSFHSPVLSCLRVMKLQVIQECLLP